MVEVASPSVTVDVTDDVVTVTTGNLSALWGNITGTLANQTDLQAALDLKSPIASPTFTGTPASTTPTSSDNSTRIATTAFVNAQGYLTPASADLDYQPLSATLTALSHLTAPTGPLIVGNTDTQTLTNKTLTAPVIATIVNTGTLSMPTTTDTLVGRATTDTLTNKTLTAPVVASVYNGGTITLPSGTRTLVARDTTDTLTNKSIDLSSNTLTATSAQLRTAVSDETGTGALVFADSPTLAGVPLAPTAAVDVATTQIATTAFVLNQGYARTLFSAKSTDQSVSSSTTLVDCTEMSLSVAANSTYVCTANIYFEQAGGGLNAKINGPSGSACYGTWPLWFDGNTRELDAVTMVSSTRTLGNTTTTVEPVITICFTLVTDATAGSVTLQFAQGVSDASDSTVKAGSWIRADKVA